ncbi:alpha/beta fold hydrolase [Streptomyces carpaticus]|uniref:alpha/beta fold hydrolase n=1 Tax=Streptomyces carpaticus TaxID=285558 RepID=UPI0031FA1148
MRNTAFEDRGTGAPLLLVHGHPFNRTLWQPQTEHFAAAGHRVIVPDLRGYGDTPPAGDHTTLDVFARDLAALLDRLGVEHCTVGGLSMGAQIALEFYRLFPDRVTALVLAAGSARADTEPARRLRRTTADRLLREGMTAYADETLPKMVCRDTLQTRPDVNRHVLAMMDTTDPAGAAAALRGRAERPDYLPLLPRITVPTLIVVGRHDAYTPVAEAELMHRHLPDSRLAVIEAAGHLPNLEQESAFNAALGDFLTATTLARSGGSPG